VISYETIYRHIWSDKRCGGNLFQHLRRKSKAYPSRSKDKQLGRGGIKSRISIDERPHVVDDKSRTVIGRYLVIGKGHNDTMAHRSRLQSRKRALPFRHVLMTQISKNSKNSHHSLVSTV